MDSEKVTEWYPSGTHPVRKGWYERVFTDGVYKQWWDGKLWRVKKNGYVHWRQVNDYPMWRGLARKP